MLTLRKSEKSLPSEGTSSSFDESSSGVNLCTCDSVTTGTGTTGWIAGVRVCWRLIAALGKIAGRPRSWLRSRLDGNWGSDDDPVTFTHTKQIQCSTTDIITAYHKFLKLYLVCFINSQMLKNYIFWIFIFYDYFVESYFELSSPSAYLHRVN